MLLAPTAGNLSHEKHTNESARGQERVRQSSHPNAEDRSSGSILPRSGSMHNQNKILQKTPKTLVVSGSEKNSKLIQTKIQVMCDVFVMHHKLRANPMAEHS